VVLKVDQVLFFKKHKEYFIGVDIVGFVAFFMLHLGSIYSVLLQGIQKLRGWGHTRALLQAVLGVDLVLFLEEFEGLV
jgi:hypothetical protein